MFLAEPRRIVTIVDKNVADGAGALRKKLKRLKMLPWHEQAKPEEAPAKSADIIAFPASRIVRRIEHGRVVR